MIVQFKVQNYKALQNLTLDLTPIHVLIGPNDSGKSSILEAIAALCRSVDHQLGHAFVGSWEGTQLVWQGRQGSPISMTAAIELDDASLVYHLSCNFSALGRTVTVNEESVRLVSETVPMDIAKSGREHSRVWKIASLNQPVDNELQKRARQVHSALAGVHSYRWNPRFLALPVAPDSKRRFRMDSSGFGLALCLDDILGYDRDRFIKLETQFTQIFPQFKSIKLVPEAAFRAPSDDPEGIPILQKSEGKGIYFEASDGSHLISAHQVSDGVLLVLAYLTILHVPEPPRVVLVEEPENGIHPKRLEDVLSILRNVLGRQGRTQIVMTTHSPYVVDLFKPEEVTLCRRSPDGSIHVRRLSESSTVRDQLDVFTLGEIWTAEGDDAIAAQVSETEKGE